MALAVMSAPLAVAGCGGRGKPDDNGGSRSTAFLQAATCADWRKASEGERRRTIRALTLAATKPDPESHGATLTDARAYRVFQRACSTQASTSAVLYEIYNRAAAFQSVGR